MKTKLFETFDAPIIRAAKNREVVIDSVSFNTLWLKIDDEIVKVEKDRYGLQFSCSCKWCSVKGIPNKIFNCSRILRAQWFLLQKNGRVMEIDEARWKEC